MIASIIVDVYCDAAEGGDFGGEFGEAGVVLSGWGLLAGVLAGWSGTMGRGSAGGGTVRGRRLLTWWVVVIDSFTNTFKVGRLIAQGVGY